MLNKFLKDEGVKFLLKRGKFKTIINLTIQFLKDKFYKYEKLNYKIDTFEVFFNKLKPITSLSMDNRGFEDFNIQLTGFNLSLSKEIFYYDFKDKESLFSVHRFRWLLIGIEEYRSNEFTSQAIKLINYWIDNFEFFRRKVNETYSICERLLNILYFISVIKDSDCFHQLKISKLENIFKLQLKDILNNLEYRGKQTNNHILNNARALYIIGSLLDIESIQNIGKKLLLENFHNHIKEGVLLEGSFHYQILLTRSILEIYKTSRLVNDVEMIEFISNDMFKMLEITQSLHSNFSNKYPLVGDISPDFPVEFFEGYPFSKQSNSSKWNNLFKIELDNYKVNIKSDTRFWKKFEFGDIEIWIIKKDRIMSHGHNDNGSFYIFYEGKPILIDIGRFSYNRDSIYKFMNNQNMHNSINDEIDMSRNSIFFRLFDKISNIDIEKNNSIIVLNIYDCFKENIYILEIKVIDKTIEIISNNRLNLFFSKIYRIKNNTIYIDNLKIKLNRDFIIGNSLYSNNYGNLKKCIRIEGI